MAYAAPVITAPPVAYADHANTATYPDWSTLVTAPFLTNAPSGNTFINTSTNLVYVVEYYGNCEGDLLEEATFNIGPQQTITTNQNCGENFFQIINVLYYNN